jgi:hypothetical protein
MPPLTDASILAQFHPVLANWSYTDYVTAKPLALDWIAGKEIYIETILQDDDPKDPTIRIVGIHDA